MQFGLPSRRFIWYVCVVGLIATGLFLWLRPSASLQGSFNPQGEVEVRMQPRSLERVWNCAGDSEIGTLSVQQFDQHPLEWSFQDQHGVGFELGPAWQHLNIGRAFDRSVVPVLRANGIKITDLHAKPNTVVTYTLEWTEHWQPGIVEVQKADKSINEIQVKNYVGFARTIVDTEVQPCTEADTHPDTFGVQSQVLFVSDFALRDISWPLLETPTHTTEVIDGVYHLRVQPQQQVWINKEQRIDLQFDVMSADIELTGDPTSFAGLFIRGENRKAQRGYTCMINQQAIVQCIKQQGKTHSLLAGPMKHEAIKTSGINHLVLQSADNHLRFVVNGQVVAAFTDSDFPGGKVGIYAETTTQSARLAVDNVVVAGPKYDQ